MDLTALNSLIGSYSGGTYGTSGTTATGTGPSRAQRRQDFEALDTALLSGDIGQAKSAFDQLNKDVQAAQGGNGKSAFAQLGQSDTTLGKDFKALSDALSGGDITGAQKAFATLRKDMQAARQSQGGGHVHGGHRHGANDNDGDDGARSAGSSSPSTVVNITIDLKGLADLLNASGASGVGSTSGATAGTDIPAGSVAAAASGGSGSSATATASATNATGVPATGSTSASGTATASNDPTSGATGAGSAASTPSPSATPPAGSGSTPAGGSAQGAPASGPAFELDLNILSYSNNNGSISLTSLSASFFYTPGSTLSAQA